jgi:hypothetical protein
METNIKTLQEVKLVVCPHCGAKSGVACTDMFGRLMTYGGQPHIHAERVAAS